ncbi:MAG: permease [Candidatus Helarchaeota archaeon]
MWEELVPPLLIGILVIVFYIISYKKNKAKTRIAIKKSLRIFIISLPIFVVALMLMGLLMNDYVLPPEWIQNTLGSQTGVQGIFIGTMLGFPLPGPRYAIYPIANALYWKGAGLGTIGALICGQQIIDVPEGMFIEIKMMGTRFFAYRTLTAVIVVFMAGCITEIVFWFIPHGIPYVIPP